MTGTHTDARAGSDPVVAYAATLAAALHGPARAKSRMVREIRDGLTDTVEAHTREGVPYERAVRLAVREFGSPDELVPSCQRELTLAQTRRTALSVTLTVPFLIVCWQLIGASGPGWQLQRTGQLFAVQLAAVAAVAALFAAAALAATGVLARRLPTPERLPLAVAWAGTTAGVAMVVATLALAVVSPPAVNWPLLTLAALVTAAAHGAVASSARACRRCARLPVA
ncbi:permease prefix domain 1-containing protein [Streptomyces sp. NBC_01498]|uniref:permease prefix domain 1-containing protein n=1 Tax=Streptomyces sp. NBC_01498 TaxID=2975870 RepID=UPI002E7BEBEF|nr:permease prefix domain 1-containing protein [Streptomyces sp. NBC_01498]WTL23810.1 permease prefix domain 1-containing protein [Streptomyces sp. NBC_01498]